MIQTVKFVWEFASWDDGSNTAKFVKYTWFGKNGKAARGGEFPVGALPQALDFAIQNGYVSPYEICRKTHSRDVLLRNYVENS